MDVSQARTLTRKWVEGNAEKFDGLRAVHLVGGITTMSPDEAFPLYKDVDLHLIFDDDSPGLEPRGPFPHVLERSHEGLMLEGGYRPISEYRSPEVVLANPEIAHHLTVDSVIHDPDGLLSALEPAVRAEYARRRWVGARLEHERRGLAGVSDMRPMVRGRFGPLGEMQMLGYSFTFASSALMVAMLRAPSTGSRMFVKLAQMLAEHGRSDLYDAAMGVFGLEEVPEAAVRTWLERGVEAFDLAVEVRRSPHFFQHKLNAHIKPYFVESCLSMLDEKLTSPAMLWLMAFMVSSCQVITTDGNADDAARFSDLLTEFFAELGIGPDDVGARWNRGVEIHDEILALAEQVAADNPAVFD